MSRLLISRTTGALAVSGALLTATSLAGLVGVEFVLNLVFPYVDPGVIMALRAGPLGIALTVVSVLFLLGTMVFMVALWRNSGVPKGAVLLYTASAIPIALRTIFPETVLQLGLIGLAVTIFWLATWLLRNIPHENADRTAARARQQA